LKTQKFKVIFWDFDGVIIDSNANRERGFAQVLAHFPKHQVEQLLVYHRINGGLSRYVKFKYFYEQILNEELSEAKLLELCNAFSLIMRETLTNKNVLISEIVSFITGNYLNYKMHIVSGSDQEELRWLCDQHNLSVYFESINGSPESKTSLLRKIISIYKYQASECVLIGDSINDYQASVECKISYLCYNSPKLEETFPKFNPNDSFITN